MSVELTPAHQLASVFSTRVFRALASERIEVLARRLAPLLSVETVPDTPVAQLFDLAHARLLREYRSEYLYKNTLVSKIVFGRHRPSTASALLEQPMGESEADVLVLNGTSTVYEIKTDLDQFSRLSGQIADYCSRAERVYVVTSERRSAAVEARVPDHVGVIALRRSGVLTTIRESESNLSRLNGHHLYRLLRRDEALALMGETIGYSADVARGDLSARLRELFCELDIEVAHRGVVNALRTRNESAVRLTAEPTFPASLRGLAFGTELSRVGAKRVLERLAQPLYLLLGS